MGRFCVVVEGRVFEALITRFVVGVDLYFVLDRLQIAFQGYHQRRLAIEGKLASRLLDKRRTEFRLKRRTLQAGMAVYQMEVAEWRIVDGCR